MDRQLLIEDLQRVAKLVRDPLTRGVYRKKGQHGDTTVRRVFGSWNGALKAAGLELNRSEYVRLARRGNLKHVIWVGDVHFPFEEQRVLDVILDDIEVKQPDIVGQAGDLYDLYSFGRFPRTANLYTPQRELEIAREKAERFWAEVRKRAPKATLYQLWGNHDDRAVKSILSKSPEHLQFVEKGMSDLMKFDGVTTILDSREELVIDDVLYIHGYLAGLGSHARANQRSVVCGHTHLGGVIPIKLERRVVWEANCGWVGNRHAVAMSYTAQRRMSRWTTGYFERDVYGPRFIIVNAEGGDNAPA